MNAVAFERLVAEHCPGVLRICRSILRDDHLVADATQETFLRLWRTARKQAAPQSIGPWLRRVAVTISLDQLKGRRRQEVRDVAVGRDRARLAPPPEAELAARELDERFERAVARLPEGQRTIFLLKHRGDLSLSLVAETLDLALPTVKTQFARACLRLQHDLRTFASE